MIRFIHVYEFVICYLNIMSIQWSIYLKQKKSQKSLKAKAKCKHFTLSHFSWLLSHCPFNEICVLGIHLPKSIFLFHENSQKKKNHVKWDKQLEMLKNLQEFGRLQVNKTKVQFNIEWVAVKVFFFMYFYCFPTQYSYFHLKFFSMTWRGIYHFYSLNNKQILNNNIRELQKEWRAKQQGVDWKSGRARKTRNNNRSENPIKCRLFFAWIAIKSWTYILSVILGVLFVYKIFVVDLMLLHVYTC